MQVTAEPGKTVAFYLMMLATVSVGVYLRLDQFGLQVLLDDEWHVIHQLLVKNPRQLFLTFGHADFSIPLALLYWTELKLFGLSEFGMRWPMLFAGLFTLVVFPVYARKYFSDKVTLLFSALLVVSPMLLIYSRTARPYALTMLLSLLAAGVLHSYFDSKKASWKLGLVYVFCAVVSAWLHLVSLPVVIAPFIVLGIPALLDRNWRKVLRLFWLGVITLVGMFALLLPPLLSYPEMLAVKLGEQLPNAGTIYGALFVWLGTSSTQVVLSCLVFAVLGAHPLWHKFPLSRSIILGLLLTVGLIVLTQPAWVHNPLTLARYLLPTIPILLLAVAIGFFKFVEILSSKLVDGAKIYISLVLLALFLGAVAYNSPLTRILSKPNSNSLHSLYQFDFRDKNNLIMIYQNDFPVSQFWQRLAVFPRDSLKIAASPFSFETHHWDAPRWEQISHQRVMPGYLDGFCAQDRVGEVPNGNGFRFKNVGYLSDRDDLISRGFDLVVYQKPFKVQTYQGEKEFGIDTADCELELRAQFPAPVYEDRWLLAVPLSEEIREQFNTVK
jgi:hypothetical protein